MDPDNNLYFPGNVGITVINPKGIKFNPYPPPVKIIGLKVNDRPFHLDTVIHRKKSLVLPYYQNNLAFEFAALNSAVPSLNRYVYRLIGGADEWVDLGHENKINISQSTFEHLQDDPAFSFVKRGKIQVKGKDDLEMYFVESG